ncbi:MAG: deoxyribodipyrimidine photolyase [Planctomycetota bacterium]
MIPPLRIRTLNDAPVAAEAEFVLYWMTAYRRGTWNFSLQRAVEWAQKLNRPLVILEALRCGYRWASDRLHQFVIEGMADNAAWFARKPVTYYPYLESTPGDGSGLVNALAQRACLVVTDDYPCFFLPRMISRTARQLPILVESIDSNGLYPMRAAAGQVFTVAHSFRRHLQKELLPHLQESPLEDPLAGSRLQRLESPPADILARWPAAKVEPIATRQQSLAHLPIDHSVAVVPQRGGAHQAQKVWRLFRDDPGKFPLYGARRNEPGEEVASGLSPYLHFGHISSHQLFQEITRRDGWTPAQVAPKPTGQQRGWWGGSESLDSFLEELIVWREIGFNFCSQRTDYGHFSSLPNWVQETLTKHAADPRPHLYSLAEFEQSRTHDPLWNACQRQLVREGRIHNYLRMLWGKKILEWTASPQQALEFMIELNNKYALDGRDPNSYTGILWVLGRYDRAWGPERPIFGLIRYMSSDNTARKVETTAYLRKYA